MPAKLKTMTSKDHVLNRPDLYMGENTVKTKNMYLYDPESKRVTCEKVTYSTGLIKIFDEILMNAVDNVQRNSGITYIKVDISSDEITISNNGESIPIKLYNDTNIYEPEAAFTIPMTSSNFDDSELRTVGGRNGIGCKLTTIFSTLFHIDIVNNHTHYTQLVEQNDGIINPPEIKHNVNAEDSVTITFTPDFPRFNVQSIDIDTRRIMYKRVHDNSYLPIDLYINGTKLPRLSWSQFVASYPFQCKFIALTNENTACPYMWRIAFGTSDKADKISFVNYISTFKGGPHVNYIENQLCKKIYDLISKKLPVTEDNIKSKLVIFVSAIIPNPSFTGQAKEKLNSPNKFTNECLISDVTIKSFVDSSELIDILTKSFTKSMNSKQKRSKINDVHKLVEANLAGTKHGHKCTLFLCEGLSAKTMVDSGMCILGHDLYGCYPLRGKLLNTRNASISNYHSNRELNDLKLILGLEDGTTYTDVSKLRYGKVVCVKDADSDGADIMGLIINFFETKFPSLLQINGFFSEFISPMIQIVRTNNVVNKHGINQKVIPFYNEVEYRKFIEEISSDQSFGSFTVKFIKGLATNEDSDIKNYFNHYSDNCINIKFNESYKESLDLAFNGKRANDRKYWLATINPDTHLPRLKGTPISCDDFVNNDLVLYSMDSCVRSIPSLVDGLKPSQRKIIYTLFIKGQSSSRKQMKVFQLGGMVAKTSNYHHGDQSMNETIIKMAQDFPGSNNIPLLERSGQFGSRQEMGDDAGQPRYISCCLAEIARLIFPKIDDVLLKQREEDNQLVEPNYYVPIIPFVLVNGVLGLGTGWSTKIPAFNPYDIINYVKSIVLCDEPTYIRSFYNGYSGLIQEYNSGWIYHGSYRKFGKQLNITEIPIETSISDYQDLLNSLMNERIVKRKNKEEIIPPIISNYVNNNNKDANSVNYVIELINELDDEDIVDRFKLFCTKSSSNMVLFNRFGRIRRYADIESIIDEWFSVRYQLYGKRIEYQIQQLELAYKIASNKARFIKENITEMIDIKNKPKSIVNDILHDRSFDLVDNSFDYLLDMKIHYLTKEKYEQLISKMNELNDQINSLKATTIEREWLNDLDTLLTYMNSHNICK